MTVSDISSKFAMYLSVFLGSFNADSAASMVAWLATQMVLNRIQVPMTLAKTRTVP